MNTNFDFSPLAKNMFIEHFEYPKDLGFLMQCRAVSKGFKKVIDSEQVFKVAMERFPFYTVGYTPTWVDDYLDRMNHSLCVIIIESTSLKQGEDFAELNQSALNRFPKGWAVLKTHRIFPHTYHVQNINENQGHPLLTSIVNLNWSRPNIDFVNLILFSPFNPIPLKSPINQTTEFEHIRKNLEWIKQTKNLNLQLCPLPARDEQIQNHWMSFLRNTASDVPTVHNNPQKAPRKREGIVIFQERGNLEPKRLRFDE